MAEGVEEACAEGVAAAEAIDDVADFIRSVVAVGVQRREEGLFRRAVEHHAAPVVVVGGDAFAERDADAFRLREFREKLGGDFAVAIDVQFAGFDGCVFRMDAEDIRRILFVADDDGGVFRDLLHAFVGERVFRRSRPPIPKLLAVVQIKRDGDVFRDGRLRKSQRRFEGVFTKSRRNTRQMKDIHAVQHGVEIIVFRSQKGDSRIVTVVQDIGTAHVGAVFRVIDAHAAFLREKDFGGIDADAGQLAGEGLGYWIVRQGREIA